MKKQSRINWWFGALLLVGVTLLLLGFFLNRERDITGGIIGVPLDDAWIHFQFARNISQGNGFSFNPGQATPGSTAPLWTLILAASGLVSSDFLYPSLALSALFMIAAVLLAYGFACWVTNSFWAAILAGLGVAFSGRLLWAGLAGMETTAFAALSLAAIWAYSRFGLRLFPALLFGLAAQLRPEGHALFALAVIDAAWEWLRIERDQKTLNLRRAAHRFLPTLTLYFLLALPYSLFSLATTGKPLPNTFYAKAGSSYFFSWRTFHETLTWHWHDNVASIILLVLGLAPVWKRSRLAIIWLLGLPLLTAVVIDFTWHHGRYTIPLIPLQMVVSAVGVYWFVGNLPVREPGRFPWRMTAQFALMLLLIWGGARKLSYWASMLGTNTREVQEIDVALGNWLADNSGPDDLIAVDDIGAIAYLSGRRIIDMNGLVSPELWPAVNAPEGIERDRLLTRLLSQAKPAYMAAFPLWRWNLATNPAVAQPVHSVHTDTKTIIFEQDAYVYETSWPYVSTVDPLVPLSAVFGNEIEIIGYDLQSGNPLEIVLYWESLASVGENYDIFVHLLDGTGTIVAQIDQQPLSGLTATSSWQEGDLIRDPLSMNLPADLKPGTYDLQMGLYLKKTGERLSISGAPSVDQALFLDSITLP